MSSFKEGIADWLKKMVAHSGDMQGEVARIVERYRARGIPCFEAKLEQQAQVALFSRSAAEFATLENDLPEAPRLVAITLGESRPAQDYKDTVFWSNRDNSAFRDLVGHERPVDACRELHATLGDKPLGYKVYCYFDGACLVLERFTLLSLLLMPQPQPQQPDEDYDALSVFDDEDDDEDYDYGTRMTSEQVTALAERLAAADGWGLARNREQRRHFARKLVGGDESVDDFGLHDAVERANVIYDMDVLPARVASLYADGRSAKEIAEITGCSQAKAKTLIAQAAKSQ